MHTKEVSLFRELTLVEQALVQNMFSAVVEAYLADIRNLTTNYINDALAGVLAHLTRQLRAVDTSQTP